MLQFGGDTAGYQGSFVEIVDGRPTGAGLKG
jgi:hypothetical protein